ncbi:MAG: hypothetical protein ABEJ30_09855 [Halorientalis sp.]
MSRRPTLHDVRRFLAPVALLVAFAALARPAAAHAGSLSGTYRSAPVPSWLVTATGAAVIGASFLATSFLTDHDAIRALNRRGLSLPWPSLADSLLHPAGRIAGVLALAAVVVVALLGPATGTANAAVLFVWAGWWAGYTATVYLVADTWPTLDPWRTLARLVPGTGRWSYPGWLAEWPAVVGLLSLVYLEVVTPVASAPRFLGAVVLGYTLVTLAGATLLGVDEWFGNVDPVAAVFRYYGRLAPVRRTDEGLRLRVPGTALTEASAPEGPAGTAVVVALLWVTTFDGLVTTAAWGRLAAPLVRAGLPAHLVYAVAMVAGFGLFWGVYRAVARWARGTADTYVTARTLAGWFAPSLLPIAAGYHLAHFLGYFLSLAPALLTVLGQPFSPPATVPVAVLPGWFGALQLALVVLGHLLAVWVAHALSFQVFPGRLQPLRSQYPLVLAMVAYTATSMWIVSRPYTPPPFL